MLIVIGEAKPHPATATRCWRRRRWRPPPGGRGCELYGFSADVYRPEVILSVEVWRDQAALDAHMAHDHTEEFLATVPGLVAGEPVMAFFHAETARRSLDEHAVSRAGSRSSAPDPPDGGRAVAAPGRP